MAAPRSTYDVLWSHQLTLMHSIDSLYTQISISENTLSSCQESLARGDLPRQKKKKLQWSRATAQKNISNCKQDVRGLLNELAATQERIGEAHQQISRTFASGNDYDNYNTGYSYGFRDGEYQQQQQQQRGGYAYWMQQPTPPQSAISPLSNGPRIWDLSRIPSTSETPISGPLSPSHNNNVISSFSRLATVPESQSQSTSGRSRSKDSGFQEPALFAHPFDIGSATETEMGEHVFAHEMVAGPADSDSPAVAAAARIPTYSNGGTETATLNPRAEEFTIGSSRIPSSPPPPPPPSSSSSVEVDERRSLDAATARTTADKELDIRSNLGPKPTAFTPLLSSPSSSSLFAGKRQRRYSEAAITIVERNLEEREAKKKNKKKKKGINRDSLQGEDDDGSGSERRLEEGQEGLGGGRRKRRGRNVADVVVDMWYSGPGGVEIVEEMVWPLTA